MKIKIALIDDHELVLQGLYSRLKVLEEFEIVGAYTTTDEFLLCIKHKEVDVVIMDLMLKDMHGFDLIKKMEKNKKTLPKVILISGFYDEILHRRALELGVKAFFRKEVSYEELISAVITVYKGNYVIPDILVLATDNRLLTTVEQKIIGLIANEYTNEKVAKELFISRRTVESHVANICRKLGVVSRIGAVRVALKLNIIN